MDTERKWRVVVCEPGEKPRKSERVWRCTSYWTASQWVRRKLLGRKRVWPSQFVRHVSHVFDDEAWHRAETIRVTMYCPVSMTRLLQLEYQDGADCPAQRSRREPAVAGGPDGSGRSPTRFDRAPNWPRGRCAPGGSAPGGVFRMRYRGRMPLARPWPRACRGWVLSPRQSRQTRRQRGGQPPFF